VAQTVVLGTDGDGLRVWPAYPDPVSLTTGSFNRPFGPVVLCYLRGGLLIDQAGRGAFPHPTPPTRARSVDSLIFTRNRYLPSYQTSRSPVPAFSWPDKGGGFGPSP
jgi:hypothetical protein